jgi:hypothetical protein
MMHILTIFSRIPILIAIAFMLFTGGSTSARAQSALCPGAYPFSNGTCTNGTTGAFSGAATATQALTDLSQSTTEESVATAATALSSRLKQERERCPDGFTLVEGTCQRIATAPPQAAVVVPPKPPAPRKRHKAHAPTAAAVRAPEPVPSVVAPQPPPIYQSRFGAWAQMFGDYERRGANGATSLDCCSGGAVALTLNVNSRSNTYGFVGGFDYTARSLISGDDGLIFGALAGYSSSNISIRTTSLSTALMNVGNGFSQTKVNLSGPAVGLFATFFSGGFSTDLLLKTDFFKLNQSFTESLAFSAASQTMPAFVQPFSGFNSTNLTNLTGAGNLNYRFIFDNNFWVEPTTGFQYINSSYGSGASQLGLADGYLFMVQGGARFGKDVVLDNQTRVTLALTALAYDDVVVHGGFIPGAGFEANNLLVKSDQGKLRGRGIAALNVDFGGGISSFVEGQVYGGKGLLGAGGKVGIRVQW